MNRIPVEAAIDLRTEEHPYFDPAEGTFTVERASFPVTIAGQERIVPFTRIAPRDSRQPNWVSDTRCVTVRVGRGIKTYAVSVVLLDMSHREPGMLAVANFTALNRQASPVGWVEDRDETNIRTGYGAVR